jgi:O-antigen/teichoic acid export membrane protein
MTGLVERLRRYANNSFWLMGEKVGVLVLALLVNILVARHLGPGDFGFLSYAVSLGSLVAVAGNLGLGGLVVRELVKNPEGSDVILGTVFRMKAAAYAAGFVVLAVVALFTFDNRNAHFWTLVIVGAVALFRPIEVVDFWFQSRVQSKYSALAHVGANLVASVIKAGLVWVGAGIIMFAAVNLLQAALYAVAVIMFFHATSQMRLAGWSYSTSFAKKMLKQGGLIFLGTAFGMINLRIDQVMLQWMKGSVEVGYFSVAASLSEAWYFVPVAIVTSVFPRLIELRELNPEIYARRLQQLLDFLLVLALIVAAAVQVVAKPFIVKMYGEAYEPAVLMLQLHILSGVFMFMRALLSKWILIEDLLIFSLVTQGLGALANVALNFLLIPKWGGVGAAWATLVSYAVSSYFALAVSRRTWPMFMAMSKALVAPLRYLILYSRPRSA